MMSSRNGTSSSTRWYREITWIQWKALIAAWSLWTLDGVDFLVLTYVMADMAKEFHIPLSTASLLVLMTYAVRWLGGLFFGNLSDRIGRKTPMLIALTWFTICAVLTGISWNFAAVIVFRLLLGIGMAPGYSLGTTLVAETWPEKYRSIGVGLQDTGWGCGGILASLTYMFVYPHFGWRGVFFVGVIPGIILFFFIYFAVHESTVWKEQATKRAKIQRQPAYELFTTHLRRVSFLAVLMFCLFFSNWPILGLFPTYLKSLHFDPKTVGTLGLIASIGQLAGFIVSGFIAEKFGRRRGLQLMLLLGIPSVIVMVSVIHNILFAEISSFICGILVIGNAGIWGSILSENLPTEVRASGVGFLYNFGSFGGGLAPYMVLSILNTFHLSFGTGVAGVVAVGSIVSMILLSFIRETKGINLTNIDKNPDQEMEQTGVKTIHI